MPVTEFSFTHDDFSLNGLFAMCDELLIEIECNLYGEFRVAAVDRMDRGFAVPVPVVISDYVADWALTDAGKAAIRKAYDEAQPDDGQSYVYTAPADHRSIWGRA